MLKKFFALFERKPVAPMDVGKFTVTFIFNDDREPIVKTIYGKYYDNGGDYDFFQNAYWIKRDLKKEYSLAKRIEVNCGTLVNTNEIKEIVFSSVEQHFHK